MGDNKYSKVERGRYKQNKTAIGKMVSKKITTELIKEVCRDMKAFDKTGRLPHERIRIDITLSREALEKIKDENKSRFIEKLVLES